VAALRKKRKLTQLELSKRVCAKGSGLDRAAIAKIEGGLRSVLDHEIITLADAFGVSVSRLLSAK
jgi:transcriptional regulator with XRE-family HTH domain